MSIYYQDDRVTLHHGDCLEVMRSMPDASVDAVVTDPPYNLSFMGREWDSHVSAVAFQQWCELWATECLRALKPGGHLISFGGTRTWHRLACAVEDAGFEVRDSIAWMYGSGFPKSLDVSKAIDKAAGAERGSLYVAHGDNQVYGEGKGKAAGVDRTPGVNLSDPPATPDAERWQGWGSALKPSHEPVVCARKPFQGTLAANVLEHGTGALNIDGCRVGDEERTYSTDSGMNAQRFKHGARPSDYGRGRGETATVSGRWPANVVLDESQAEVLDEQSGVIVDRNSGRGDGWRDEYVNGSAREGVDSTAYRGEGGASRFFKVFSQAPSDLATPDFPTFRYQAKAPTKERPFYTAEDGSRVAHPTTKPLSLMSWLVRLVTPPGGTVLEPFAGSGTTVEACVVEGFQCVAIEKTDEYLPLITQRINRQRDPVAYMQAAGDDLGLFDFGDAS